MRICAVTGSRADWGLLKPVLARLRASDVKLQLLVTGSHLQNTFGHTVESIEADGFRIDRRVPLEREGDDELSITRAMASAIAGIAAALNDLKPDLLLILGDRYEIFAAAQAALFARIPVAHIAGGDISEGAYDDAMRHAISKLSHLHFATNADARQRLLQMGENPQHVFNTGSPGVDNLLTTPRWNSSMLERTLHFNLRRYNIAISFHPATLDPLEPEEQIAPLLDVLATRDTETGLIFTGANADSGGDRINGVIRAFVNQHENACFTMSLGSAGYFSLIEQVDLLVGNSSSGLYEAPTLRTPTVDIGLRQQGRLRGPSVCHVDNDRDAIANALGSLSKHPPTDYFNPYGEGTASAAICETLLSIDNPGHLLIKHFTVPA